LSGLSRSGREEAIGIQQGFNNTPNTIELAGLATVMKSMFHRDGLSYGMPEVWPEFRKVLSIDAPEFVNWFDENISTT